MMEYPIERCYNQHMYVEIIFYGLNQYCHGQHPVVALYAADLTLGTHAHPGTSAQFLTVQEVSKSDAIINAPTYVCLLNYTLLVIVWSQSSMTSPISVRMSSGMTPAASNVCRGMTSCDSGRSLLSSYRQRNPVL